MIQLQLQNKLINGDFSYWQRNITFATIANNTYTADRWVYNKVGTAVHTVSRSTDTPLNSFGTYSLLADCTTAQASILSTDFVSIEQRIEGNLLKSIKSKKIALSFYVKATKVGVYCVSFRNASGTKSFVKEYTINTTNTWEKKTVRLEHDASGSWNYDHQLGMRVSFVIAAGTNFHTSENAWQSGDFISTANQVNGVDNIANDFQIADVMLVEDNRGQTREPEFQLAGRDFAEELQLCQRYFCKSFPINTIPSNNTQNGKILFVSPQAGPATVAHGSVDFPSSMRSIPLVTPYNPFSVSGIATNYNVGDITSMSIARTARGIEELGSVAGSTSIGNNYIFAFTADAEL